jgi:hypothetical protein
LENIHWKYFQIQWRMSDSEIVSHSPPGPHGTDTKGNPAGAGRGESGLEQGYTAEESSNGGWGGG